MSIEEQLEKVNNEYKDKSMDSISFVELMKELYGVPVEEIYNEDTFSELR